MCGDYSATWLSSQYYQIKLQKHAYAHLITSKTILLLLKLLLYVSTIPCYQDAQ